MAASLEDVDRLTDFLWASVVLASYYAIDGRMVEGYTTISAAAAFALACGLDIVTYRRTSPAMLKQQRAVLLPEVEPDDLDEINNRARLSRGIYITSRTLAMVGGWPSVSAVPPKGAADGLYDDEGCVENEAKIQEMGVKFAKAGPEKEALVVSLRPRSSSAIAHLLK